MSILKLRSKDFEMEISMDGNGECNITPVQGSSSVNDELAVGLIALSLNDYGNSSLHDKESGVITIVSRSSEWSSKSYGLNRGINVRK